MGFDSAAIVGIVVPLVGAIFSFGVLFQRAKRTEKDVADVRQSIHKFRSEITATLMNIQLDVARLAAREEMAE